MNPTVPFPQPAEERLATKLGEISQGLAANGGGEGLAALLIGLINLLLAALRSIAAQVQDIPFAAEASPIPATPLQASEAQPRSEATSLVRSRRSHPAPRKPKPRNSKISLPPCGGGKGPVAQQREG